MKTTFSLASLLLACQSQAFGYELVIRENFASDIEGQKLDNISDYDTTSFTFLKDRSCRLVLYRNGDFYPELANQWLVNKNKTEYTFKLNPNATFETGEKVTSEIIAYNLKRHIALNGNFSAIFKQHILGAERVTKPADTIPGIEIIDAQNLRIKLKAPFEQILPILSSFPLAIFRPQDMSPNEDKVSAQFSGCGPYTLVKREKNSLLFKKKRNYWLDSSTAAEEIEYRNDIKGDEIGLIKSERLSFVSNYTPKAPIEELPPQMAFKPIGKLMRFMPISFNSPAFAKFPHLPRLINIYLDREALANDPRLAKDTPVIPTDFFLPLYSKDGKVKKTRSSEARKLVTTDLMTIGKALQIDKIPLRIGVKSSRTVTLAENIKEQLGKVGIKVELVQAGDNPLEAFKKEENLDLIVIGESLENANPSAALKYYVGVNPELSGLRPNDQIFSAYTRFDKARTEEDHLGNLELFDKLLEKTGAAIPLFYTDYGYLFSTKLHPGSFQNDSYRGLEISRK